MSDTLTSGSLCTGYAGLDTAVEQVMGTDMLWLAEYDDAPAEVCAERFPTVPNLHDITIIDWTAVPPVDVLTAGYPCQPFSLSGSRKGEDDERHLWPYIAEAIRVLRPRLVVLENVPGHRSLGFGTVLGDLASVGYVGSWTSLRASDVGACHRRERVFIVATDAHRLAGETERPLEGRPRTVEEPSEVERVERLHRNADPDTDCGRREVGSERHGEQAGGIEPPCWDDVDGLVAAATDATRGGRDERLDGSSSSTGPDVGLPIDARGSDRSVGWGEYEPAVRRHERAIGRAAPAPVDDEGRLAPPFVEWMMMLPAGWVTDVISARPAALKCLGNGVVPPQAIEALQRLLARQEVAA